MEEKDYKKLYEDVVALAKDGLKDGLYLSQSAKDVTEFLFPQLKETEDEKVKRELTRFLINFNNGYSSRPSETEIDSWIKWIDKKASDIEIIPEKTNNNSNPKFKIGDWIVYEGFGTYKVIEIHEGWYSVIDSNDRRWSVMFEKESLCHLWTIQDAKDGDILTSINEKQPFIFKGLLDPFHPTSPVAYCGIDCEEHFIVSTGVSWWADAGEPASKEIVDLLFKSIKEAGYEWNSEKKELNKIEQKPTEWSLPYGKNETAEKLIALAECLEMDGDCLFNGLSGNDYGKLLRVLAIELTQPKQEWSDEDEIKIEKILKWLRLSLGYNDEHLQSEVNEMIDWLKFIKERVQPQPKQEWSKEDSERLLRIHQFIWANRKGDTDEIYQQEQDADWIMSLNPQQNNYDKGYNDGYSAAKYNQWKPSEYDILLLENIASKH